MGGWPPPSYFKEKIATLVEEATERDGHLHSYYPSPRGDQADALGRRARQTRKADALGRRARQTRKADALG